MATSINHGFKLKIKKKMKNGIKLDTLSTTRKIGTEEREWVDRIGN